MNVQLCLDGDVQRAGQLGSSASRMRPEMCKEQKALGLENA